MTKFSDCPSSTGTIVRGHFDKLPNNCQMLENDKVEHDMDIYSLISIVLEEMSRIKEYQN